MPPSDICQFKISTPPINISGGVHMKFLTMLVLFSFPIASFAQERVLLNEKQIDINSSEAIVVRTADTPKVVKLNFMVPMSKSVCEQYSVRTVLVTSGVQCGYDRRFAGYRRTTTCVATRPNGGCARTVTSTHPVYQTYPRTCSVQETYCAQYGTITVMEQDQVKIKFKNLSPLAGSEEETFRIKAEQKNYDGENVVYKIEILDAIGSNYEVVKKGLFGFDSYVIRSK